MNSFKAWLSDQRKNLENTIIPSDIYESEKRWNYFIEHNYDYESNWFLDKKSSEEKHKFLKLKESYLKN